MSYRVTGTLRPGGKQQKRIFQSFEDAEAVRETWDMQRIHGAAALRPKMTHLTLQKLREAEALFELAEGAGFTVREAVMYRLEHRPTVTTPISYQEGLKKFLDETLPHVGKAQHDTYRQRATRFGEYIGLDRKICSVTEQMMVDWLASLRADDGGPIKKKTWNNLFGDVSAVFAFFVRKGWIAGNPFKSLKRFSKRALGPGARKRLTIEQCRALMSYLENQHPEWVTYFAITLFAGIRPDLRNGEMAELARCVQRDGIETYYSNGMFHLTAEITKEGESRQTTVRANLAIWLQRYPPTPKSICPGDPKECSPIRTLHGIPHDGLRHTCISAFMSEGSPYHKAADEFGNSEPIIKRHYLQRMPPDEAAAFYEIIPNGA